LLYFNGVFRIKDDIKRFYLQILPFSRILYLALLVENSTCLAWGGLYLTESKREQCENWTVWFYKKRII